MTIICGMYSTSIQRSILSNAAAYYEKQIYQQHYGFQKNDYIIL